MLTEATEAYRAALRMGQRELRACLAYGKNPYPALLSDDVPEPASLRQECLGVVEVPAQRFVGVRNVSRQEAFSASFYPLLGETSEFASKWIALYQAHLKEGIRDAVKAYEYRNQYYVEEGNKRVSVLRFFDAAYILADVTRIVAPADGSKESNIYTEFLNFYKTTGILDIYFTEEGRFTKLLHACGDEAVWNDEERMAFRATYQRFRAIHEQSDLATLVPCADAFLTCVEIFGYETLHEQSDEEMAKGIVRVRAEIAAQKKADAVILSLDPTPASEAPLLSKILPRSAELTAAFLFERTVKTSPWTAVHDAGRERVERNLAGKVHTLRYDNVLVGENDEETIEKAIEDGADIIFTTTPKMIAASVKAAVHHPEVKILNCSMNMVHPSIRTYYARVYEIKFLIGAIAGAMSENGKIGYLADYPIYGVPANINAFAKGAQIANPRATVQLEWSGVKNSDPYERFRQQGVTIISGRDLRTLESEQQNFGLYHQKPDGAEWLALPYWHWGKFYTQVLNSILCGTWKTEETRTEEEQTINYWWGLSSGVLDIACSGNLPPATLRLMEVLRQAILDDKLDPLAPYPEPYHTEAEQATWISPSPDSVLRMDTLADNVIGKIPELDELMEQARPLVLLQGLHMQEAMHP